MIWKQNRDISQNTIDKIANELGTSHLLVRILLNRVNDEQFARIVFRDRHEAIIEPELLHNGKAVAERIAHHIKNGSMIYIHADYDADGINAGFLMNSALNEINESTGNSANIELYYPQRVNGYGLSMYFAEKILKIKKSNKNRDILVITVDNGIAQIEQINHLVDNGIEVVVTDHHTNKEVVPNCLICDPHNNLEEQDDVCGHLCGTAIAFKVCELVQKEFGFHNMYKYAVNVAIATITDVMPLTSENIAFVNYGLEIINSEFCPIGIKAMKTYLGIDIMNSQHLAWEIGPRLNACGRIGDTNLAGMLLAETDYEMAEELVNKIEVVNDTRKELTVKAVQQMESMNFDNNEICLVELKDIPEGIVGIIAGRAVDKFNKPCIAVVEHDGVLKGSARSANGINMLELLDEENKHDNVLKYGGHKEAAGVQIPKNKSHEFVKIADKYIRELLESTEESKEHEIDEELLIDECIEIAHINENTFNMINFLPYDKSAFAKPVFALTDCKVMDSSPTKSKPENLWLTVKQGRQTIKLWCQGMTETYNKIGSPKEVHLAGYIEKNFMVGRPYILKVIDIASV